MLWRIRRKFDELALAAMAFVPASDVIHLGTGEPLATIAALGDIALGGAIGEAVSRMGATEFVSQLPQEFFDSDLRIANLETVLTDQEQPAGAIGAFIKASPAMSPVLTELRLDAVTLANNHVMDYGTAGLLDTIAILDRDGVRHCGIQRSAEASQAAVVEARGLRFGILGYTDEYLVSAANGIAPALADDDRMVRDVVATKKTVDFIVLQLHWGYEFSLYPLLSHRDRARKLADAGADLVLCHHAHVPMGIEVWKGKTIAYGLGNFIFEPTPYQRDAHPWTDRAFILCIGFARTAVAQVKIIPVGIDKEYRPCVLRNRDRSAVLGAMRVLAGRLQDTSRLSRFEYERCAREALEYIRLFRGCRSSADARVREGAQSLRSPRQQHMIRQLTKAGGPLQSVGSLLESIAEDANEASKLVALVDSLRQADVEALVAASARKFAAPLPGRRP